MYFISTKTFLCKNKYIYFLDEQNGIFGKIDMVSGDAYLFDNTPEEIFGKSAYDVVLLSDENYLYLICRSGTCVIRFSLCAEVFEKIIDQGHKNYEYSVSWAGCIKYENRMYLFTRDNGNYLLYDLENNTLKMENSGITEKITFSILDGNNVYMISWDLENLYCYSLITKKLEKKNINIKNVVNVISKSPVPIHAMNYDEGYIYILDARHVIRIDVNTTEVEILYSNAEEDNGARIVLTSKNIMIPPLFGEKNVIINKCDGKICRTINIPKDVNFSRNADIKVGIPCENDECYCFPMIDSDSFLLVDKIGLTFKYKKAVFNESNVKTVMNTIFKKYSQQLYENALFDLERYIENVNVHI